MSTTPQPEGPPPQHAPAPSSAPPPNAPPAVHYYYPPPPPRRRGFWARLFLSLLVLVFLGSLLMNFIMAGMVGGFLGEGRVQEKFVSHNLYAKDKIAIIPVEGVILGSEDGFVKRAIDAAMKDDNVKAVVLRVDSPGGSVTGSDYIYHHLRKLVEERNIPLVVSMGGIAASGGYYVSMAVGDEKDAIYAERTGWTGSIGVIIPHYDISGLMKKYDVVDDSVPSNPLKEMGSPTKPMTPQERDIFKRLVDDSFTQFKHVVMEGRPEFKKDPSKLDKLATGQVYTAEYAKEKGLIDEIGFLEDAVNKAIELARLDKEKVKVVRYKSEPSLSSMLWGSESRSAAGSELKALLDMTTPRAYYLFAWPPAGGK